MKQCVKNTVGRVDITLALQSVVEDFVQIVTFGIFDGFELAELNQMLLKTFLCTDFFRLK